MKLSNVSGTHACPGCTDDWYRGPRLTDEWIEPYKGKRIPRQKRKVDLQTPRKRALVRIGRGVLFCPACGMSVSVTAA